MAHVTYFKSDLPSRYEAKKDRRAAKQATEREVYAMVTARDHSQCRVCGKKTDPYATGVLYRAHHHHIVYRSAGGQTTTANVVLLDPRCHNEVHASRLRIDGNADEALMFWRRDQAGEWFMVAEEASVGTVRRD